MQNILEVKKLSKKYQSKENEILAIDNINFSIREGEFVSIIGPSGCGKSTLLSVIAGLIPKSEGKIYIEGEEILGVNDKMGYMLQKDCLLEWKTILSNILFGLEIKKKITKESKEYAEKLLKKYELYDFKNKFPSELSGGMRQRVSLIRTLSTRPKILLLDEAFSALDYQTRLLVSDDVYRIIKNEGKSAILVTHDISEGISMSDKVVVLSKRPATVKDIQYISLRENENLTPLESRKVPQFQTYFDIIWKEFDIVENK